MWNQAFTESNRIAGGQMRPFGAIETCKLGKIFVANSGCGRLLNYSIPDGSTRRFTIFKSFQSAAVGKVNKNDFATAASKFLDGGGNVMKALFNSLPHLFAKLFFRNVCRRGRRREKREPDLLNCALQFSRPGAFFDHARATFAIDSTEVRWKPGRHQSVRTIWNGQSFQEIVESQFLLFQKCDMFFQWHSEILADALRRGLSMRSPDGFFSTLHRWRARRGDKQARNVAANNRH